MNDNKETLSSKRWLMVLIYLFAGASNALLILTFSPIIDLATDYFFVDENMINLLAVVFQIMFVPGTLLLWSQHKYHDMRGLIFQASLLTCCGCLLRLAAGGFTNDWFSYSCVLLGTAIVALAQPFYLTLPAEMASLWFGLGERDMATTVCGLANPLGSAIGSLLPSMFVTRDGDDDNGKVDGVFNLLLTQFLVSLFAFILVYFSFEAAPAIPPTRSAQKAANALSNSRKAPSSSSVTSQSDLQPSSWSNITELFANKSYVCLFTAFVIGLAHLLAVTALLGQLPGGFSSAQLGGLGAILILCGFVGAFMTGLLLDTYKSYQTFLRIVYVLGAVAWIFFLESFSESNFTLAGVASGLLGAMLLAMVPITTISSVEAVYPISPNVAVGTLYCGANVLAIGFTFFGSALLKLPSSSLPSLLYPYAIWVFCTSAIGVMAVFLFESSYKRLQDDQSEALLVTSQGAVTEI